MTYSGFDKKGVLIAGRSVINGSEKEIPKVSNFSKNCIERYIVLQHGQRVGINDIEIEALKTVNEDESAIGFKFYTPQFTMVYASSTKYSAEIAESFGDSGILILNVANPNKENNNYMNKESAIKIIKKCVPRLAILTGFGKGMIEADPLYVTREVQRESGVQTLAAKDGMVVSPVSYAAQEGQRTFGTFKKDITVTKVTEKKEEAPRQEEPKDSQQKLL